MTEANKKPLPRVHLHKLALQLSCPICLGLFTQPILLPCDHVFCNSCVTEIEQNKTECPICTKPYVDKDKRKISLVENIISIYRNLEAAFLANVVQPAVSVSGSGAGLERCTFSVDKICDNHRFTKGNLNVKMDIHNGSVYNKFEELESSEGDSRIQPSRSQLKSPGTESCGTVRKTINSLVKSSPQSPSSGDNRSSNNDGSAQDHNHRTSEWNLAERDSYNGSRHEPNGSSSGDGIAKGFKRQRKSYSGVPDMVSKSDCPSPSDVSYTERSTTPSLRVEITSAKSRSELSMPSEDPNASQFSCDFCQSSRISEVTGSMLHYANGKPVEGDGPNCLNVIHVHAKCFEWAPQVYHEGEIVKNLEIEVARGAKLKCSRCGRKGAALGCYNKTCKKSYHFPCAVEVRNCRWDTEGYLLLCPRHCSSRFPCEKSKPKSTVPRTSMQTSFWKDTPVGAEELVFCGSALPTEDKFLLVEFAGMVDLTVSKLWKPDVTHLIVDMDENGAYTRTIKVLMAILKGCWILKIDWIKACMKSKRFVHEEPFEVSLDNQCTRNGPKTGRLRALANGPKLFSGLHFYFSGDVWATMANDYKDLIAAAGGSVLENKESLLTKTSNDQEPPVDFKVIIVYYLEITEECQLAEGLRTVQGRISEAQELASKVGGSVVGHKWLIESVAGCKLLPFVH